MHLCVYPGAEGRTGAAGEKRVRTIMNLHSKYADHARPGPGNCPSAGRPVDLVHLERQTLGNRSLEHEVLELFHSRSEIYLRRLKDAREDKAWGEAAHAIKGSARGIGAWHVADSAQAAEALTGKARVAGGGAVLDDLERAIGQANSYIESLLSGVDRDASSSAAF